MYNFVVSTVPADGLTPLGARASAGAVIKFGFFIYKRMALEGLTHWSWNQMADILQMTFSHPFSWMKIVVLWFTDFTEICSH